MYDTDISHTALSAITDKIIPEVKERQSLPLEDLYIIIWLGAMHYKVKEDPRMNSHVVYNIIGIDRHGYKTLLGIRFSK